MDAAERRRALGWLGAFVALGAAWTFLYPDSYQQDGGYHYLGARWAWAHPALFVDVWGRPLFTLLYSLPAQLGYPAAKLLTVAVVAAAAWQTFRLAGEAGLARPHLAVPFLVLQPATFLIASDTMTEPLFALVFVVALRLHRAGRVRAGMIVASLSILARPEGFFLGVLWGLWVLVDSRDPRPGWRRLPSTLWLASGAAAWWLASWAITGDPLFIKHNWPPEWSADMYGRGRPWDYLLQLPIVVGPLLLVPFAAGAWRRPAGLGFSAFATIFVVHSLLWTFGKFGSAGYARYFVCVAPATALLALAGWNELAARFRIGRLAGPLVALSALFSAGFADAYVFGRDAWAVRDARDWQAANRPRPAKVVWTQAYMAALWDQDPWERPALGRDKAANLETLRKLPPGTLACWDSQVGPSWYALAARDLEGAGWRRIWSKSYRLEARFAKGTWFGRGGARELELVLLVRE